MDALTPFIHESLLNTEVSVTNGKGAFSSSLAEYVLTAVLHFNKQIVRCQANRKERKFDKFVMDTMDTKTVGFVGFGHIASLTAAVLKRALNCKIMCVRRNAGKGDEHGGVADQTFSLEDRFEMFAQCDYVVSVLPGTPETIDFMGKAEFAAMKKSAVFVSIGRGVTVDEEALADVLESGAIAGAALDVFKVEPLPQESRLWDCENLLLTAHNADFTTDYFELGWSVWGQNLQASQEGASMVTPVDKQAGY